ncbi:Abi family protein [Corynebacterium marquesiae]|uniref:Abi family protein n=1 Tax=Corynebacterium marquesiae TaxID=2913503 RepID=UPI0038D0C9C0
MRYFQEDLAGDEARFYPDTQWDEIVNIYRLDVELRSFLLRGLQEAELAARTAFALSEGEIHSPYEEYLQPTAYRRPPNPAMTPTHHLIISELKRSKEPYLHKYRKDSGSDTERWIYDVPIWVAVEALSFGTLSKAISFRNDDNQVYAKTCSILGVKKQYLTRQLRSFTFVRNKCAHSARLWNSFVLDQPSVSNATKRRAERVLGQNYGENSLLAVIVALDCQMRVFGTGVLGTRYCRVPGSWYRAEGCVGPDR